MYLSSVREWKSLQQLQEEVALNGSHPHGYNSTHQTSKYVSKSVQSVAPAASNRTSNNRHQEIQIIVCIFYNKKKHIVIQLFLESPRNIQNAFFKNKNLLYYVHKNNALCLFLLSFFLNFLCSFFQLSK